MSPRKDGACVVFAGPISFVYDRRDFSFCSTVTTAKTTARATRWVRGFRNSFNKTGMRSPVLALRAKTRNQGPAERLPTWQHDGGPCPPDSYAEISQRFVPLV